MKASIEYLREVSYMDAVEIEDIGNIALVLYNDAGQEWYLLTTTSLGWTKLYMFGPLLPDVNSLVLKSFSFTYSEIEYREYKIISMLEKFIQDPKKEISQVIEITKEEVLNRYKTLNIGEDDVC